MTPPIAPSSAPMSQADVDAAARRRFIAQRGW